MLVLALDVRPRKRSLSKGPEIGKRGAPSVFPHAAPIPRPFSNHEKTLFGLIYNFTPNSLGSLKGVNPKSAIDRNRPRLSGTNNGWILHDIYSAVAEGIYPAPTKDEATRRPGYQATKMASRRNPENALERPMSKTQVSWVKQTYLPSPLTWGLGRPTFLCSLLTL